ncbi:MAG: hypothetical protein RBS80_26715 [Thermoguttaceae bacterium]|nr:hypothetical protein [Thermoguttaceae bacterium]
MTTIRARCSVGRRGASAGLVFAAILLGGCGSQPYSTVRISGTVTYDDGSLIPAKQLFVQFEPQQESIDGRQFPRPGQAQVSTADGTFGAPTTYAPGDGVVAGEHKVVVEALNEHGFPDYSYFPKEYSDPATTPLRIEVGPERTFKLEVPKPR